MVEIDGILISDEVWNLNFECNLKACRGLCCKVGILGAPIDDFEEKRIFSLLEKISVYLPPQNFLFLQTGISEHFKGKLHIREMGKDRPCPLGFYDETGILRCSLHRFSEENHLPFEKIKPMWCSLFPLVVVKNQLGWQINVHLLPHCRNIDKPRPILLTFSRILEGLFGQSWMKQVAKLYGDLRMK